MSLLVNWLESMHVDTRITKSCSRKKHLRSTCRACMDACHIGALTITSTSIKVVTEKCNSCGECMIACPLSAIEGVLPSREYERNSLVYNESYIPKIKELLIYKQRGVNTIKADRTPLNQIWLDVLSDANKILQQLNEGPIQITEIRKDEGLSRRAFLTSLQTEGKQLAKSLAPAAWMVEANEWKITRYYGDYQFYQVEINLDQCTLCQLCFSFCSQKVFSLEDHSLRVHNEKCVNCCDCMDICPEGAIEIKQEITKKQYKNYPLLIRECKNCGKPFSTFQQKADNCPICHDRNPEWLSP
ncbi:4Fe-4S binding protein [Bacillus sp. ISL-18]|uniref:4Fe-4S binding protein n=1 Tax=Bacillus sp. ISL-18 TaxID=2819118 RepID=UPI001BE93924|nr:4Fe-4S dicluster domain-containing protein [Bacillus sp. ISL-18]MBT2656244.1 4Fe-4S binding protein [Bacillus sp. ISL-18]